MRSLLRPIGPRLLLAALLCLGVAERAAASPIFAFGNHSGEDHSNESHVGEYLEGIDLSFADLSRSDFSGSDLTDADLTDADMSRMTLTSVDLTGAVVGAADLSRSDLQGATVIGIDFSAADLTNGIWTGALYDGTTIFPGGFDPVAEGMTLVPDPSTGALLSMGLLGLGVLGRRNPRTR